MSSAPPTIYPAVRPELPPTPAWSPIFEEAYAVNWFTNFGALSRRLEIELASRWGRPGMICVAASSGTVALAATLIAQRIQGKVIVPAFTFAASAWAIKMAGATPVLADVTANDWRICPDAFDAALRKSDARAAMLVAPFGLQLDLSSHLEIAARRDICLVIDNAAGLGAAKARHPLGENVFEVFSLHATKPFGIGEGGAIIAAPKHEASLRSALNFGISASHRRAAAWGVNGKLSELHAAVGLAVAASFEKRLERRREMAQAYISAFSPFAELKFPDDPYRAPWQLFPVLMPTAESADAFEAEASRSGLQTRRYYQPSLSTFDELERVSPCPVSEDLARRMICLPIYSADAAERAAVTQIAASAFQRAIK